MKKYIIVFITSLVASLICFIYPFSSTVITSIKQQMLVNDYNKQLERISKSDVKERKRLAQEYNNKIKTVVEHPSEASTENTNTIEDYYNALSLNNDNVIGYIKIPKIDLVCPIYSEATDEQLQKGIGHIKSTSLPVGGIGTHCVLSGHTGLVGNKLFTDLDELVIGDIFYLHTLDNEIAYKVVEINVVLPSEANNYIKPNADKDLCTLITCTPYGINSHRLLVKGERTQVIDTTTEVSTQKSTELVYVNSDTNRNYIILSIILTILAMLILAFVRFKKLTIMKGLDDYERSNKDSNNL